MLLSAILFVAVLYSIALIVILYKRTESGQPGRGFLWLLIFATIWVACEVVIDFPLGATKERAVWIARTMFIPGAAMFMCWIWFCAEFPVRSPRLRPLCWFFTITGVPWIALAWTDAIVATSTAPPWQDHLVMGEVLALPCSLWFLSTAFAGIIILAMKSRTVQGIARVQIGYVLLGAGTMLGVAVFCDALLPALTDSSPMGYWGPLSSIIFTTATTYAIVRYKLFDINIILRTGITYSLTIAVLSLAFAFIVPAVDSFFIATVHFPTRVSSFTIALIIALAFQPLRQSLQRVVDRVFFCSKIDYNQILQAASASLASAKDRMAIAQFVADSVDEALHPDKVIVYLPDQQDILSQAVVMGNVGGAPEQLDETHPILLHLQAANSIVYTDEYLRHADPHRKYGQQLRSWGIGLAVPLITGYRWCGLLVIGNKLSGDPPTSDEIALLSLLRSQAALSLDNALHYEELKRINATLESRVQQRTAELAEANLQLQRSDQIKDEFLATVSHELLTPLTSILGWSDMALQMRETDRILHAVGIVKRNAERQKRLVDDLLDVSRLIHKKMVLSREYLDIWSLVEQVIDSYTHQQITEKYSFIINRPVQSLTAQIDPIRLQQVFSNLINNAFQFTPPGGIITISGNERNNWAVLEFSDNGQGIPEEHLSIIFDTFQQGRRHSSGGMGLGLALARGIIELHGGRISASSPGIGEGSTFRIELPLCTTDSRHAMLNSNHNCGLVDESALSA